MLHLFNDRVERVGKVESLGYLTHSVVTFKQIKKANTFKIL